MDERLPDTPADCLLDEEPPEPIVKYSNGLGPIVERPRPRTMPWRANLDFRLFHEARRRA